MSGYSDKTVFDIIATGMDLPAGERDSYVDELCGSDRDLARRIKTLIAAEEELGTFLSEPAQEAVSLIRSFSGSDDTPLPESIGRYHVIRRIGRGGMGNVYLARQHLDGFSRDVAVKVIRRGMDSESVVNRFRMERSILASLNHPNIARLLDAGTADDGRAFCVMEYVDGKPITKFCDERYLTIDERIDLFDTVCRAVHHAHKNLVVHRDIKPSNILVTADGTVKLLDFGIAKILDTSGVDYTLPITGAEGVLLTPDYASPEQLRGGTISTASDVYSLGILLFELISGHRPFRSSGDSRFDFASRVANDEPGRPSLIIDRQTTVTHRDGTTETIDPVTVSKHRGLSTRSLRALLSGELDTIVLKAIRKAPDERYASVEQLREDLRRYRKGEPVLARPATMLYRLHKAYTRHRAVFTGIAAMIAAIVALTSFYIWDLSAQRTAAEQAFTRAENVRQFVVGLFEQGVFSTGGGHNDEQVRAALTLIGPVLEDLDQLAADPVSRVDILNVVGEVLSANASQTRAIEVLRRAQEIGASTELPVATRAATLHYLGRAFFHLGNTDSAYVYSDRAYEMRRAAFGSLNAETLNSQKYAAWASPNVFGTYDQIERVLQQYEIAYGPESVEVANLLSDIGQGHEPISERYFLRALDIYESTIGLEHPLAATTMANLSLSIEQKDSVRALDLQVQAMRILETTLGESHPLTLTTLQNVGAMYTERHRFASADSLFRIVEARYEALDPNRDGPSLSWLYWSGRALLGLDQFEKAGEYLSQAMSRLPVGHGRYVGTLELYVQALINTERRAEARRFVESELARLNGDVDTPASDRHRVTSLRDRLIEANASRPAI